MLNWIGKIFTPTIDAVNTVVKTVAGDKSARDRYSADANIAALNQYADEFKNLSNRTWFDAIVDGINRLVRPTLCFTTFAMFPLAYYNPEEFSLLMASLALIPEPIWTLFFIIIGFYLPSRMIEKVNNSRMIHGISMEQAKAVQEQAKAVLEFHSDDDIEEEILQDPIESTGNPSVDAWLARNSG